MQVAIVDSKGKLLEEKRVGNIPEDVEELLSMLPYGSRIAVESSSIWRDAYDRIAHRRMIRYFCDVTTPS